MIQELIPGSGGRRGEQFSYAALCRRGEPLAQLVARRTRQYPPDFGRASTFVETDRGSGGRGDVEEAAPPSRLRRTGRGRVQARSTRRRAEAARHQPARLGWHTLAQRAGVDFPYLAYRLARGEEITERPRARTGERWLRVSTDLPSGIREVLRGNEPLLPYLKTLFSRHESAIFARDDPCAGPGRVAALAHDPGAEAASVALSEFVRAVPAEDRAAGPGRPASLLALDDPRWCCVRPLAPQALIFHRPEWGSRRSARATAGGRSSSPSSATREAIDAGIPVIGLRDLRRRERWDLAAVFRLCPPLLSDSISASGFAGSLEQAVSTPARLVRGRGALAGFRHGSIGRRCCHTTTLSRDADELFARFHRSQVQRNIRRAEREQMHVRELASRRDFVDVFYRAARADRRRQGMPVSRGVSSSRSGSTCLRARWERARSAWSRRSSRQAGDCRCLAACRAADTRPTSTVPPTPPSEAAPEPLTVRARASLGL